MDEKGDDSAKSPKEVTCMAAQSLGARNTPLHTNLDNEALHTPSNAQWLNTHGTTPNSRGCNTAEHWMPLAERAEPPGKAVLRRSCAAVLDKMVWKSGDRLMSCLAWRWTAVTGLEGRASSSGQGKCACVVSQSLMKTRLRSTIHQPRAFVSLVVCKNSTDGGRDRWHQGRSLTQNNGPRAMRL